LKHKKKTKNRISFNSLLPITLNPYLQALFLQTWKIQNQQFPKKLTQKFQWLNLRKKKSPKLEKYFNNPLCKRRLKKFRKRKKWEAFAAEKEKKRIKIEFFFNSLLQTTLNPYLQTLFLKTCKFQNQNFT